MYHTCVTDSAHAACPQLMLKSTVEIFGEIHECVEFWWRSCCVFQIKHSHHSLGSLHTHCYTQVMQCFRSFSDRPLGRPSWQAFTVIELLVVVSIIGVLMSMLLPALVMIRRAASVVYCANNQRQLAAGFLAYSHDYGELPTCYKMSWSRAWNWGDEGSGRIDSTRGPSGPWPFVHLPDGTSAPSPTADTPFSLAWEGGFVTSALKTCQKPRPPYGESWFPWYAANNYLYNGPGAAFANIGNNSSLSGLFTLGGYRTAGATHGFSVRQGNGAGRTALFVCPGIISVDGSSLGEPHSTERWTLLSAFGGNPNGQDDWGGNLNTPFNRNVTFGDGHTRHIAGTRNLLLDP